MVFFQRFFFVVVVIGTQRKAGAEVRLCQNCQLLQRERVTPAQPELHPSQGWPLAA